MGATIIGALRVALGLDTATFDAGAKKAETRAYLLGERIGKAIRSSVKSDIGGLVAKLGGAVAVSGLVAVANRALEYASSLGEVSQQLGVTTRDLQVYRYAASQVGIEQETMEKGLARLTLTMGKAREGVKEPVDTYRELSAILGKDVLKGAETAGDAIPLIAEALSKVKDPSRRAAIEVALFGKAGQKLDTLLSSGATGVNQLAKRAEELGLVLSDDQIQSADETADKIAELRQQLEAKIAGTVADNADSIMSLANALASLTSEILKFLKSNPEAALAIVGGLAGSAAGGLPGAGVGVVAGYAAGAHMGQASADANMDPAFRRAQLEAARKELRARQAFAKGQVTEDSIWNLGGLINIRRAEPTNSGATIASAQAEVIRQQKLLTGALQAARTGKPPRGGGAGAGTVDAETKANAAAAAREARQAASDRRAYQADLTRAQADELDARRDLTVDAFERRAIEQQLVEQQRVAQRAEIESNDHLDAVQKAKLKAIVDQVAELRSQRLDQEEETQLAEDALKRAQDRGDNQIELMQAEADLVTTARERRAVELRILAKQFELEKLAQQAIIDNKGGAYSPQEVGAARDRLNTLNRLQPLAQASVLRNTEGPLEGFLRNIPDSAAEANEALQNIAADGLQSLDDGILDVIKGAKSMADVFENVADRIISALIKIAIQQAVVKPFGNFLSGLFGAGIQSTAGAVNSMSAIDVGIAGARAAGGPVMSGKSYLVGELGPEIFTPSTSGRIIPNKNMMGGKGLHVQVSPSPYFDVRVTEVAAPLADGAAVRGAAGGSAMAQDSLRRRGRQQLGRR
jgi:hypothetical protein